MKHPSLKRLFESPGGPSAFVDDAELSRLLTGVKTSDGSWKITRPGRHDIANKFLIENLAASRSAISRIFDVGVSSGIPTAELISELESANFKLSEVVAVDRYFDAILIRCAADFHALIELNGHIMRLQIGSLNFSPWCSKSDWLTGIALGKKALVWIAKMKLRKVDPSIDEPPCARARLRRSMRLLSPSLERNPKVRILEHDLFESFGPEFREQTDLVRAANVFNVRRLTPSGIRSFAMNLGALCREGGFVYVCDSKKAGVKASLFSVRKHRLELVTSSNGGVEAEAILKDLRLL